MLPVLISVLAVLRGVVRSRVALHLEVLALRHQLQVLQRSRPRRVRLATADRWLLAGLSRSWSGWRTALVIVKPETVIAVGSGTGAVTRRPLLVCIQGFPLRARVGGAVVPFPVPAASHAACGFAAL